MQFGQLPIGVDIEKTRSRFMKFVYMSEYTDCWIWTGAKAGGRLEHQRYGVFRPTWPNGVRRNWYAHHVSYFLFVGPLPPEGECLRHSRDNPLCVNPNHIIPGTQADNVDDAVSRDRHTCGSRNGRSVLTEKTVSVIFEMRARGATHREIADRFDVSRSAISLILEGKNWKRASKSIIVQRSW